MTTHPSEINQALATAFSGCDRLIADAEKRGDQAGADAWLVARNAIGAAELAMAEARRKQDWSRREANRLEPPPGTTEPFGDGCVRCIVHRTVFRPNNGEYCPACHQEWYGTVGLHRPSSQCNWKHSHPRCCDDCYLDPQHGYIGAISNSTGLPDDEHCTSYGCGKDRRNQCHFNATTSASYCDKKHGEPRCSRRECYLGDTPDSSCQCLQCTAIRRERGEPSV